MQTTQVDCPTLPHSLLHSQVHPNGRILSTPTPTKCNIRLLFLFLGTMCSQTTENTTLNAISSSIVADVCPITCTRACWYVLLHNCIQFAFAHNGALQHVPPQHRGCPLPSTSFLVAWASCKVIFAVGLLAIFAASSLGRLLVTQLHYLTSCDFLPREL